jgi:hypothetical protein
MSTFRNPVGPQQAKVYWRRRLLLGLGVLAVIIVIILIIVRPGSGGGTPVGADTSTTDTKAPDTKTSDAPASSDAPSGTACLPGNLKLEAVTDKTSYGPTEQPLISMTITNTGAAACTINLGSTQQELTITSGTDRIWDSKDCQTGAVDAQVILDPNKPKTTPTIPWDRTRSSTSTCSSTSRPAVTAGGASYHLGVKVGTLASKSTAQFILN